MLGPVWGPRYVRLGVFGDWLGTAPTLQQLDKINGTAIYSPEYDP